MTVVVLQPVALAAAAQSGTFLIELKSFTVSVRQRAAGVAQLFLKAEMWPVLRLAYATGGMRFMHVRCQQAIASAVVIVLSFVSHWQDSSACMHTVCKVASSIFPAEA